MDEAHFGFERVSRREKVSRVMGIFSSVAEKYDLMNDLMSMGLHRCWKKRFIALAAVRRGMRVLDLAAGSGDIALALAERTAPEGRVILCDLNAAMLQEGRRRMVDHGFLPGHADCIQADGTALPFADQSFDAVCIAFGIRNFPDVEAGLRECYRVLSDGGHFACLEFSRPVLPLLEVAYDAYSFHCIPTLGEWVTGDRQAYQYLVESIRRFPDQKRFARLLEKVGFQWVEYQNMSGGIVAVHRGYRL